MSKVFQLATLLSIFFHVSTASAQMVLDFTGGSANAPTTSGADLGWRFTVGSSDFLVTHVGIWDEGSDGLVESHLVEILTDAGAFVPNTLTTVDNTGTIEVSANGSGRWIFEQLSVPVVLSANSTYRIAAEYVTTGAGGDPFRDGQGSIILDPGITYIEGRFNSNPTIGTVHFPGSLNASGMFGPNFMGSPIPEPSTIGFLAFAGFVGLALAWRRKRQAIASC